MYYTTPSKSAFITAANVAVVPVIGMLHRKKSQKSRKSDIYGIFSGVIALLGVGLISFTFDSQVNIGDVLTLFCMIFFALHIYYTGLSPKGVNFWGIVIVQMGVCAMIAQLVTLATGHTGFTNVKIEGVIVILYMAFFTTSACYLMQTWAQTIITGNQTAVILSTECIFGSAIAIILGLERLSVRMVVGAVLILVGAITSQIRPSPKWVRSKLVIVMLVFSLVLNVLFFLRYDDDIYGLLPVTEAVHRPSEQELDLELEPIEKPEQELESEPIEHSKPESKSIECLELEQIEESEQEPGIVQEYSVNAEMFNQLRRHYGNESIVAYLRIEGTSIDYPVLQAQDNLFYLNNNIDKQQDRSGWIFLDYRNDILNGDHNMIIYGHNMRDNIRFHSVRYYKSRDYFEKNRFITLSTEYENQIWEIFSFYVTMIDPTFFYTQVHFQSRDDFVYLLEEMKSRSMYDTGVQVSLEDRILTLTTSTNVSESEMYVLNARLVE
jgi:SrtB family sortase